MSAEIAYEGEAVLSELILCQHLINYAHEVRGGITETERHPVVVVEA